MKDFFNINPLLHLKLLYKTIRKAFCCRRRKHLSFTRLFRPTKQSIKQKRNIIKTFKNSSNHQKNPFSNINIKKELTEAIELKPQRCLADVNELKPERFHLDIEEYPLNQISLVGKTDQKLLIRVSSIKLTANPTRNNKKKENFKENGSEINGCLKKYYKNRYLLFSKYDSGVKLDDEAWFSTTPEIIAEYLGKRIGAGVVLDGFCGVGGNTIQFAKFCQSVISIDIDPIKITAARHNAKIYEVESKIQFINQDFLNLSITQQIDWVFLAPPWGGIDYSCEENYSLLKSVRPNMRRILEKALEFSNKLILSLPRNSNIEELLGLLVDSGKFGERASVEIEKIYLNNRFKMIMVYFGNASKISKSIEYSQIYQKVLDKRQKGFNLKQKEMVKDLIERFGMIEILNLADSVVGESQEGDNGLVRLGKKLMEKGLVSDEELVDFYCSDDIN